MAPMAHIELTNEENPKPVLIRKATHERQRQPLPRLRRTSISNPTFKDLFDIASSRTFDIILESKSDPPPRLFPNSEHIRHTFFPLSAWEQHGNMETEFARISYMLARYPERGLPLRCSPTIQTLLRTSNPLEKWSQIVRDLADQANIAQAEALQAMRPQFPTITDAIGSKSDFVRTPVSYPTDRRASMDLWTAAVEGMALDLEAGDPHNVEAFLHIHAFIKDPIGGLKAPSLRQIAVFLALWNRTQTTIANQHRQLPTNAEYQRLAAQLALEASFLAVPKLQKIRHVHFSHHQQLCYVYTTIDHLPRAEFSIPTRVLDILLEIILETSKLGECAVAPIAISYTSALDLNRKPRKVIIDGNNRVSALVLLRFLARQSGTDKIDASTLDDYCTAHGLGLKWLIDLRDVLDKLLANDPTVELLRKHWNTVVKFTDVSRVPALLVQEPSFFTLCLKKSTNEEPVLLQPMHQTLFNDDSLCVAFAAKAGQAHGRSLGYAVLAVKYAGDK